MEWATGDGPPLSYELVCHCRAVVVPVLLLLLSALLLLLLLVPCALAATAAAAQLLLLLLLSSAAASAAAQTASGVLGCSRQGLNDSTHRTALASDIVANVVAQVRKPPCRPRGHWANCTWCRESAELQRESGGKKIHGI